MDGGFSSFDWGAPTVSGAQDGNYTGAVGVPNINHNAIVVGIIVVVALGLLITGVIGLRASGEVVI